MEESDFVGDNSIDRSNYMRDRRASEHEYARYELFRGPEKEHLARYQAFILDGLFPDAAQAKERNRLAIELNTLVSLAMQQIAQQYMSAWASAYSARPLVRATPDNPSTLIDPAKIPDKYKAPPNSDHFDHSLSGPGPDEWYDAETGAIKRRDGK